MVQSLPGQNLQPVDLIVFQGKWCQNWTKFMDTQEYGKISKVLGQINVVCGENTVGEIEGFLLYLCSSAFVYMCIKSFSNFHMASVLDVGSYKNVLIPTHL